MEEVIGKFAILYTERKRLKERLSILKNKQRSLNWRDSNLYSKLLDDEFNLNNKISENLASIIKLVDDE